MMVDGVEYGETREYGNFSFTRVYEAGHEVPFYQPIAALQIFNRTINKLDIPSGTKMVSADYETDGEATATHTESYISTFTPDATSSDTSATATATSATAVF